MRKSSRWAVGPLALVVAFVCAAVAAAQPRVGGYNTAETNDAEVVAAAEFAVSSRAEQEGTTLSLVAVARAEIQVVAGRNYKLCLEVKAGDETDAGEESQYVQAVVYQNLQRKYTLKSWEPSACADSNSEGNHSSRH